MAPVPIAIVLHKDCDNLIVFNDQVLLDTRERRICPYCNFRLDDTIAYLQEEKQSFKPADLATITEDDEKFLKEMKVRL